MQASDAESKAESVSEGQNLDSDEMSRQECIVTSELLPSLHLIQECGPLLTPENVVSKFSFKPSTDAPYMDEDGDLIVTRKGDSYIQIEHSKSTTLDSVGLQVWRGALLLADWALHHSEELRNETVLELGSGTGLSAIAAAMVSREVIATDVNIGNILPLIRANVNRNSAVMKSNVRVMELDFFADEWSTELQEAMFRTTVVIAADVIYDDVLTEAFVKTLKRLLSTPPAKTVYMALEKRFVFTLADFDSVAPCFEHFLRCIAKPDFPWKLESISCDFPQYFNYEKTKELAMWKIVSNL